MQNVFHLSHIDLDGYGCQYLTTKNFDAITCYNANYGPEVKARLEEIFQTIDNTMSTSALILVTDLNLTPKEALWLEQEAKTRGVKLQLLDHHATGQKTSEQFLWYSLDTSKSATQITYEWLQTNYNFDPKGAYTSIVEAINAVDIWQDWHEAFEYGKVMLGMISGAREINRIIFPDEDRSFKLSLIQSASSNITQPQAPIWLDDNIHQLKKQFFTLGENNTKDNLVATYITKLLTNHASRFVIHYKGYKGLLGYSIGSASIIGNTFLVTNPDFDFYMDIGFRGNFSLRSNDSVDVSEIAATIGNGGGHPNASGGKIEGWQDSFVYENIRNFVQNHINDKTFNS